MIQGSFIDRTNFRKVRSDARQMGGGDTEGKLQVVAAGPEPRDSLLFRGWHCMNTLRMPVKDVADAYRLEWRQRHTNALDEEQHGSVAVAKKYRPNVRDGILKCRSYCKAVRITFW